MKQMIKLLSITFYMCLVSVQMLAQETVKIYPIVFCNTIDANIGVSCANDQKRFTQQLGIIETALGKGCEVDQMNYYTGNECNKPNLERAISDLHCTSNDVIFFYYSGHGIHAKADTSDDWLPQMCLTYQSYDQDKFVPVKWVRERLASKGARLVIILTDCCNNDQDWVSVKGLIDKIEDNATIDNINIPNLRKLFFESKGTVVATSSKRGQTSLGPKNGGVFSVAFWDEMYRIEQGSGTPNWESLMSATVKRTQEVAHRYNAQQDPVFKVNINGYNSPNPNPNPNPNPVIISVNDKELGEAFRNFVSSSRTQRMSMVESMKSRLFTIDAKVELVGMNLTTTVGYRTIGAYLNDLSLNKNVKGINIVSTNKSNGKYNYIVISEIR